MKNLRVEFPTRRGTLLALDDVSFDIAPGEVLGVVGESGAGKSLTGAAIIGLLEPPGRIAGGEIRLEGRRIDNLPHEELRKLRGRRIGAIFQDPLTSLNPLYTVGRQLVETIRTHLPLSEKQARERAIALLADTGIPAPEARFDQYPHQFSGGMRQRVVIALALAAEPKLIVADEPTTALDVSIQAQIIALLKKRVPRAWRRGDAGHARHGRDRRDLRPRGGDVRRAHRRDRPGGRRDPPAGASVHRRPDGLDPGHGRGPRAPAADRRRDAPPERDPGGLRVQSALPQGVRPLPRGASRPRRGRGHARGLLAARQPRGGGVMKNQLVEVQDLAKTFDVSAPWLNRVVERKPRQFVARGRWRELRHRSRPARSRWSANRAAARARWPACSSACTRPREARSTSTARTRGQCSRRPQAQALRRRMQMIFQDPYASLNPRWKVLDIVAEPLREHGLVQGKAAVQSRVGELLMSVGLAAADALKFPHQFSGGQRQRISIARALATQPEFLVCDEPTSALDVSVQAQVLNIMKDLQQRQGLTYLFISHNLAVVRHVADDVGVMYLGRLVEVAAKAELFARPRHPYTRMLLDAIPDIGMSGRARTPVQGEVPNPLEPPSGCSFHPRCPHAERALPRRAAGCSRCSAASASPATRWRKGGSEGCASARAAADARRGTARQAASRSRISQASLPDTITSAARPREL